MLNFLEIFLRSHLHMRKTYLNWLIGSELFLINVIWIIEELYLSVRFTI